MPRLQARRASRGPSRRPRRIPARAAAWTGIRLTVWPRLRLFLRCRPAWRYPAGCPSGQRERSVKPSAQPTLVRTQHLPPPLEMGPELGRFGSGPSSVICSRMPFVALVCSSLCQIRAKVLAVAALGHLLVIPRPGGFLDTALGFLLLPGDALDVATSSGPISDGGGRCWVRTNVG